MIDQQQPLGACDSLQHFLQTPLDTLLEAAVRRDPAEGVDWRSMNLKLVTAGEVFSEEWRSLVCERTGATEPAQDTASLYGTADAGVPPDNHKQDTIADAILTHLRGLNSEFANYTPVEYQRPRVTLHAAGDPTWFPPGVKHRYTRPA